MKFLSLTLIMLCCGFLQGQQINFSKVPSSNYPGKSWEYLEDPSVFGWNTKKLEALTRFIVDSANTTGMMVIHHGKVIYTFGDIEELSYIASCRKSVLAMLYGPFVENGKINLNTTLEQLQIDDVNGLLPIEKKATIQNLLTARSGVYHDASYPGDERDIAPHRGTVMPGTLFIYNNWDFNLAGYVFEKLSGVNIYHAVDSMLAQPLHMEDWDIHKQRKEGDSTRSVYPAYPMWFSTRDMARIGYLMLHNGTWEGKPIISVSWVHKITTPFTTFNEAATFRGDQYKNFGYGYLWWPWDIPNDTGVFKGAYSAQGAYGQFITVLPLLDLVIAHKTNNIYQRATDNYYDILDKLLEADDSISLMNFPVVRIDVPHVYQQEIPSGHTPSDAKTLEQYEGEYTSAELHVTFRIEVKDQKLYMINTSVPDSFALDETKQDLFTNRRQKFLFQRSLKGKKDIIGFSVQIKGLPDKPFIKIK